MARDNDKREPITPPQPRPRRAAVRAIVEAIAQVEPVSGALTRIYQTTHPPKAERERDEWQGAISERTNEHSERLETHEALLMPKETITGATAELAAKLICECPDGLGQKRYSLDQLATLLPDTDRAAVEDAAHELEQLEILSMWRHLGGWHAALTPLAYVQLDPQLMGWNPTEDAAVIASLMLEHKTGDAPKLEELTGWERRRFNVAFRVVIGLFPAGRVRKVLQSDYPSLGVAMAPEDRVQLRRFIERVSGGQGM